jgi:UDP-glucose 4-epimerase
VRSGYVVNVRVVIVGASGNLGTSVLRVLAADDSTDSILGVARRRPEVEMPKTDWVEAQVESDPLADHFAGADAVVHLAWLIQPSRDRERLRAGNVLGSQRVFDAVAEAGVQTLIYVSSVGAYSPGPKDRRVDESWPTEGIDSSFYARDKADVEDLLDRFEAENPEVRVVRLRPGLMFKREAGTEIRRLFVGPFAPRQLFDKRLILLVPRIDRLRFQAVHTDDVAGAMRLALQRSVAGPFNLAAEPVLDPETLARVLDARTVPMPASALRAGASSTWRLRIQPTPPGWVDLALAVPLMSTERARRELGWQPRVGADEALLELLAGMRDRAGAPTPPLDAEASGPARSHEVATGIGARNP